jgi:type IV secretion system protein VirD4
MKHENFNFERYFSTEIGSSRWADPEEIISSPTIQRIDIENDVCTGSGIPIISDGRIAYVDNSDTHTLIIGSTGSKKTRLFGMPLINIYAMAGESFIATDPKGELISRTSGLVAAKGYKTVVLNFRDLYQSDFWNPLQLPFEAYHGGKKEEAVSLLNDFLGALAEPQRKGAKDPYWIELAYSMALAYMLFFIDTATPDEANLFNFAQFFASKSTPEATEELANYVAEGSIASVNLKGVLTNKDAKSTFGNVASGVSNMFNPFVIRKSLCKVLSKNSFDIRDIGKEKTAVYIIVPDEKTTLHFLATAFIKQTYEALIHEAQQQENKKLPVRVNFLLDEFANIPKIKDMASMITAARSRNIRFFLMIQGMNQLINKYEEDAQTIKGNCDNLVFLTTREFQLLEEVSNLCGLNFFTDHNGNTKVRPLISTSELQRFNKERGETLIIHGRNYPIVSELPDIDQYKFKFYLPEIINNKTLPQIVRYDVKKVMNEIKDRKRPIPFSDEVSDDDKYFDGLSEIPAEDLFWNSPPSMPVSDDAWDW